MCMTKSRLRNPIFLFYVLVAYVLIQFSWWIYLIFSLNKSLYTDEELLRKKLLMLLGEGAVFLIILLLGVFAVRRAFKREKELVSQHENFLMSVSHELKTPIASLKLFLQTLDSRNLSEEKRKEIYQHSLGDVDRLENLVGNILLTKNISNRNYFLNRTPIALDELVIELTNEFCKTFLAQHKLVLDLQPITLMLDREAMVSILTNLIQNAAKYSPEGSKIEVTLQQREKEILLSVKDEGPGIASNELEKVFSKFYRIDNEMTRKSKGTGLGLFITKALVLSHNATIQLKKNSPKGLVAEIRFKDE